MKSKEIRFKYGTLWINPVQDVSSRNEILEVIETEKLSENYIISIHRRLSFQLGPVAPSGILGATLYRNATERCSIELPNSAQYKELSDRYPKIITDSAQLQLAYTPINSRRIVFDYLVHHPIDSHPYVFARLARCIVKIFALEIDTLNSVTMQDIVELTNKQIKEEYNSK
jgi:hypothetical protein